ncbi:T9SS type A sorting domain-containing protein [Lacibacter luteus]|uniref:T9SS type A sorting domain-containing protein n=1 Tax=Lacibacter luteus TaxID=2508719 RepID=A0A4Q1CIM1_9BACT|nr:T9SS type A sorting domain-containing protein [Lacibacter luteus]RXK60456.1 T9SS type A sorting domain-containing protein [Lacibacter luteus]
MKKIFCFCFSFYALVTQAQVDVTNNGTLYITGSSTDSFTVVGNFTNSSSATFTNNGKVYAKQNFTNNQSAWTVGSGELFLTGTGTQYISTTSNSPFYKLTVNKASGLANLSSAATVNHTLNLTSGKLSIGNYDLTIANSAAIMGAGTNNYVVAVGTGVLKQQVQASGSTLFPVGLSSVYTPVTISLSMFSTTDVFNVRMLPAVYSSGTSGSVMNSNVVNATWMVSETVNGGSNATLTCQWPASIELTGFNRVFSRLAHYTSSAWDYGLVNIMASGSNPYTVTRAGFTSFSPFTVTMQMAILPGGSIELSGRNNGDENIINWSTSSETNTSHFSVETSLNGIDFTEAGKIIASGYSTTLRNYQFVHQNINNRSYYYRIKLTDADGTATYSKIIRINVTALKTASLYPNPVKEKTTISFSLTQASVVTMLISNTSGSIVYNAKQLYNKGDHAVALNLAALPAATYILQLKDDSGALQTIRFIKTN